MKWIDMGAVLITVGILFIIGLAILAFIAKNMENL